MEIEQIMSFLLLLVVISAGAGAGAGAGVAAAGPSSIITSTCSAVVNATHEDPGGAKIVYDDCVGMLSAYPETASAADLHGVAIAAVDITAANITNMEGFIQELIGNLQNCLGYYKVMGRTVAGGMEDLRAGRIDAAVNTLTYADTMPEQCLIPYMYAENPSPIDKEIVASINMAAMASRITRLLESAHKV